MGKISDTGIEEQQWAGVAEGRLLMAFLAFYEVCTIEEAGEMVDQFMEARDEANFNNSLNALELKS